MNPAWLVCAVAVSIAGPVRDGLPEVAPAEAGIDAATLGKVDDAIGRAIKAKTLPGAVVLAGRRGKVAYAKAYGLRAVEPAPDPMTRDTIFDLASLTKPVATSTSVMILVDRGKIRLDDTLGKLLPEFDNHGKGTITVEQLLRHRSGLIADNAMDDYARGPEPAFAKMAQLELVYPPGARFLYSDVNFIVLGRIVEKFGGRLDRFAKENIFEPLGMTSTFFDDQEAARLRSEIPNRFAPTEPASPGGAILRGVVHDPRSRALGGIAGHAGLFGTADDLAIFCQMLLDEGKTRDGRAILKPETVRAMISPGETPAKQRRGLGWDLDTPYSGPRGRTFGPRSFGHTGFTGTSVWIDPDTKTFVILLASNLHPGGKHPSLTALRGEVASIVGSAIREP